MDQTDANTAKAGRKSHHKKDAYVATVQVQSYEKLLSIFENAYKERFDGADEASLLEVIMDSFKLRYERNPSGNGHDYSDLHKKAKHSPSYVTSGDKDAYLKLFVDKVVSLLELCGRERLQKFSKASVPSGNDDDFTHSLCLESIAVSRLEDSEVSSIMLVTDAGWTEPKGHNSDGIPEQIDASKRQSSSLSSSEWNSSSVPKRRAVPDNLRLPDQTLYQFLEDRFHRCFWPSSTYKRLYPKFFPDDENFEQIGEDMRNERLLEALKQSEVEDQVGTWRRCQIPFVQVREGEGISFALNRVVEHSNWGSRIFKQYVKRNTYNRTIMAQNAGLLNPLTTNEEHNSYWDNPKAGTVLAVPMLRPFCRHYFDLSGRAVTLLFGYNLESVANLEVGGQSIPMDAIIQNVYDTCQRVDSAIKHSKTVVIQTNDCLAICSDKCFRMEEIEVTADYNNPTRPEKISVKSFEQGELEGLVVGYHLKCAKLLSVNNFDRTFELMIWSNTSFVAGIQKGQGVLDQPITSLCTLNTWESARVGELTEEPWPTPGYAVKAL